MTCLFGQSNVNIFTFWGEWKVVESPDWYRRVAVFRFDLHDSFPLRPIVQPQYILYRWQLTTDRGHNIVL